jgi:hypothetical protein
MEGTKNGVSGSSTSDDWSGWTIGNPTTTSEDDYYNSLAQNVTLPEPTSDPDASAKVAYISAAGITTSEWLSFFLMTVGALDLLHHKTILNINVWYIRMVYPPDLSSGLLAC